MKMRFEVENILKEDPTGEKKMDSCYFRGVLKAMTMRKTQTPSSGHQT